MRKKTREVKVQTLTEYLETVLMSLKSSNYDHKEAAKAMAEHIKVNAGQLGIVDIASLKKQLSEIEGKFAVKSNQVVELRGMIDKKNQAIFTDIIVWLFLHDQAFRNSTDWRKEFHKFLLTLLRV